VRQAIEKQLDRIEHVHRFTRAVSVGNPREFLEAEKEDQEVAEACKRLIKNCIICWNYLYLSQKLEEIKDTASRGGVSRCRGPRLGGFLAAHQRAGRV
jgi:TnpA family transposase